MFVLHQPADQADHSPHPCWRRPPPSPWSESSTLAASAPWPGCGKWTSRASSQCFQIGAPSLEGTCPDDTVQCRCRPITNQTEARQQELLHRLLEIHSADSTAHGGAVHRSGAGRTRLITNHTGTEYTHTRDSGWVVGLRDLPSLA